MSNISVREALELPELHSLEVIAGKSGLDREIRDVTVLEVPDPFYWLKGGELLLTTFYGIRENESAQAELLTKVAPIAAGICFNPGAGTALAPRIINVAEELSLPLLRMPGDMPYAEVIRTVLQAILNRRAYLLSRSTEINSMLINTILNGADSKEVVSTLARLVKNPVVLLDASLNLVKEEPYYEGGRDLLKKGLPQLLAFDIFHNPMPSSEYPAYAVLKVKNQKLRVAVKAIMIKSSIYGYLAVWEVLEQFDEIDIYAIAHASTAIALDFIRDINLVEQRQKMINNLCDDLLSGRYASEESIIKQGEMYGLNLPRLNVVIVVQTGVSGKDMPEQYQIPDIITETDEVVLAVRKIVESQFADSLVARRGSEIIVALGTGEDDNRKKRTSDLAGEISRVCNRVIGNDKYLLSVGGFTEHFRDLARSYSQAGAASRVARYLSDHRTKVFFDELGIYRLLYVMLHTPEIKQYVDMVLPGADSCDQSILETLEAFIECQKSFSTASKNLYVHPNTVKYRINKAKEKWGEEIVMDNNCLDTLIAIKLNRIFNRKQNI